MAKVSIYTLDYCPYCDRAKELMTRRGVSYTEIRVDEEDDALWESLYQRSQMRTMPQIYLGEGDAAKLIGGYQELASLDQKDSLASLK